VKSLARSLDVLGLFSAQRPELSLSEIAELLSWPAPTAHRTTTTLMEHGFLARDPGTKRFKLGPAVLRLVAPMLTTFTMPEVARPLLAQVAEETGETVHLAVLDGPDVLYLTSAPGRSMLRVEATPGLRVPAHCTALGKCLLARLDPDAARSRLGPEPYAALTPVSVRTWDELRGQLETIRRDGYALSLGEYEIGLLSCAVPVPARDGIAAAINLSCPEGRIGQEELVQDIVPRLQETAATIARASAGAER
jgi:DNA-binding IclR family transcriptional regulator